MMLGDAVRRLMDAAVLTAAEDDERTLAAKEIEAIAARLEDAGLPGMGDSIAANLFMMTSSGSDSSVRRRPRARDQSLGQRLGQHPGRRAGEGAGLLLADVGRRLRHVVGMGHHPAQRRP